MKENPKNGNDVRIRRRSSAWKPSAVAAAIIAVLQACLTIRGMGVEGFVLWVLIIFLAYWLFFTLLILVWRRFRDRG